MEPSALMHGHALLLIVGWSLLCAVDGCVLTSAAVCISRKFSALQWAFFIALGHLAMGLLGLFATELIGMGAKSFALALAIVVIGYISYELVSEHISGSATTETADAEESERADGIMAFLKQFRLGRVAFIQQLALALCFSVDALLQGCAVHGQCMECAGPHSPVRAALFTCCIAFFVGLWTFCGCIGLSLISSRGGIAKNIVLSVAAVSLIWFQSDLILKFCKLCLPV